MSELSMMQAMPVNSELIETLTMNSYRLSKEAEQDLEDLWVYLGERDDIAADRQVAKLLNRFPMLAQFPNMGISGDRILSGYEGDRLRCELNWI